MRARALLAVLIALLAPSTAAASGGVEISQRLFDENGNPMLTANFVPDGSLATPQWRICTPDCGAIVATGNSFSPGPTAVGTVFQAEATYGETTTARTPPWKGQVASATPPTVTGDLRVGGQVDVQRGTWSGGWGDDTSVVHLDACRTADGQDCHQISQFGGTVIDPVYAGWYLRAWSRLDGFGAAYPAFAIVFPAGEVSPAGPSTASQTAALGPLVGPIPAARPGAPPTIKGSLSVDLAIVGSPGTWPDRPASGQIVTGLRACPTRAETDRCVALTALFPGAPQPPAVVATKRYLGWFVGAVDWHAWPTGSSFGPLPLPPLPTPAGAPATPKFALPQPGPTVLYGPLSKDPIGLGFTPKVTLRRTAFRSGRHLTLGQLRCRDRCRAHIRVWGAGDAVRRSVVAAKGTRLISIGTGRFDQRGRVNVRITFDHSPARVSGVVALP